MSYIGGTKSLLILGSNTKDDLIPSGGNSTSFELSQEVPGGYESSITVVKQKYTVEPLVSSATTISIEAGTDTSYKVISCDTTSIATVLAAKLRLGDKLLIQTSISGSYYNNTFTIIGLSFDGTSIEIQIQTIGSGTAQTIATGTELSLSAGQLKDWEILEPEIDYVVSGTGSVQNRMLTLSEAIQSNDKAYVLHKGEATYNLVPSVKSVGPEQLSENLRAFTCDRYTGNATQTTFALSNTDRHDYAVIDAKTLLVTVDKELSDSDADGLLGDWILDSTRDSDGKQTITFHTAPSPGAKIRILHLGFSTISRRAVFSAGQDTYVPAAASVGVDELKNLAVTESKLDNNSVSARAIIDGSVTSTKISLTNNVALSGKKTDGSPIDLLKLNDANKTVLHAASESLLAIGGVDKLSVTASAVSPKDNNISIGSETNKFKDLFLSGGVIAENAQFSGNITSQNLTTLTNNVSNLTTKFGTPIGAIVLWSSETIPSNWRLCDGQELNTYTFRQLHQLISNTFGGSSFVAGTTDASTALTKFKLPDIVAPSAAASGPEEGTSVPLSFIIKVSDEA